MAASGSNFIPLSGKHVVIIGDGPAALLTAVKLKLKGVTNVTLVGDRLEEFTRSGDFIKEVFAEISAAIYPLKVIPSSSFHIKDVERQLYQHAKTLGVNLIKKKFIDFGIARHIIIANDDSLSGFQLVHADILFECTGTKRAVLKRFNDIAYKEFKFSIEPAGNIDQHNKAYAFIRAEMELGAIEEINIFALSKRKNIALLNPIPYVLAIEAMRKLGWTSYTLPIFYINDHPHKKNPALGKANIYFEAPPGLNKLKLQEFMRIIFRLIEGNTSSHTKFSLVIHHESKKYPRKETITTFSIDPHLVTPGCYLGDVDVPALFHAGDASADLPFTVAGGLRGCIRRLESVMDTFSIQSGEITGLEFNEFNEKLAKHQKVYRAKLTNVPEFLKDDNNFSLENILQIYWQAHATCSNTNDQKIIQDGIKNLELQYALELFNKARTYLNALKDKKTGWKAQHFNLMDELKKVLSWFEKVIQYIPLLQQKEITELKSEILDMVERTKILANYFYKLTNYSKAKNYYQLSLEIDITLLPQATQENRLKIYSNLILVAFKQNNFEQILLLEQEMKSKIDFKSLSAQQLQKISDKIHFYVATAHIELVEKRKSTSEYLEKVLPKVDAAIKEIRDQDSEFVRSIRARRETLASILNSLERNNPAGN